MFKIIENLPDNVLGIEVHGRVTHEDYIDGIIPAFDKALEAHEPLKVLYVISDDFEGVELAAMWDDAAYGVKHWSDISKAALVCDLGWAKATMTVFAPFFPGEIRSYDLDEVEMAREWVAG